MYRKLALALTVAFQPLIVPSAVIALLFYAIPESTAVPREAKWSLLLLIVVTTFLIPMVSIIGMRMTSLIPSIYMVTKKERVLPFFMVTLFYMITSGFFYVKLYVDPLVVFTLIVISSCVLILSVVTCFWRISAHITGLAGLLAIVVVLAIKFPSHSLIYPLIAATMACGSVGSARLYLEAHTPSEVLGGFLLGFFLCFAAFYYFAL